MASLRSVPWTDGRFLLFEEQSQGARVLVREMSLEDARAGRSSTLPPLSEIEDFLRLSQVVAIGDGEVPMTPRADDYLLDRLKKRYRDATFIHPSDVLCHDGFCDFEIDGTLLYQEDGSHLNPTGSVKLGQHYLGRKRNPLRSRSPSH